jgi:hypothetical protein
MSETFATGDLLSITTKRLLSPDGVDGIYRIVDYVTGVSHFTHQLPRGADAIEPWLIEQHPWLASVTSGFESLTDSTSAEDVRAAVSAVSDEHGEFHVVEPLPAGRYVSRDPVVELVEMIGADRVVPIILEEPEKD